MLRSDTRRNMLGLPSSALATTSSGHKPLKFADYCPESAGLAGKRTSARGLEETEPSTGESPINKISNQPARDSKPRQS